MDEPQPASEPPEHDSDQRGGGQESVADQLRQRSAFWALLGEEDPELTWALQVGEQFGIDNSEINRLRDKIRQQALLMHSMTAAQARAYDEMMEAGGPDDPEAYEAYKQATEFHTALLTD